MNWTYLVATEPHGVLLIGFEMLNSLQSDGTARMTPDGEGTARPVN